MKSPAASFLNNELSIYNKINSLNTYYASLEQEIIQLEQDLINIKEININYDPVIQKPSLPIRDTKFPNYFIIISSILLGFFISITIILFRFY